MPAVDNCSESFPSATELTIIIHYNACCNLYATDGLRRTIPLTRLKKLTINSHYFTFKEMVDVILHTPNIHTLAVVHLDITAKQVAPVEESETFRLVSKQNKIKSIQITNYLLRTIRILIKLCPELQHLSMGTFRQPFEAVIRFLLSENKKTPCHVPSLLLGTFRMNKILLQNLRTIVESKKNVGDYSLKAIPHKIYLWW